MRVLSGLPDRVVEWGEKNGGIRVRREMGSHISVDDESDEEMDRV